MGQPVGLPEVDSLLRANGVNAWGVASNDPPLPLAPRLPRAISLLVSFHPAALEDLEEGPTETYHADYQRLNATLNTAAASLGRYLEHSGYRASLVEATLEDYAEVEDWGDAGVFAHKTAATQAGLGWIGKTGLFISPVLGPKLRLATVFTDLNLPTGTPVTAGRCGSCRRCVDACPAGAGRDVRWRAGMARDLLFDEKACERYLDDFPELDGVCGACVAVCPFGRRALARFGSSYGLLNAEGNPPPNSVAGFPPALPSPTRAPDR
jgi:epoxyqueuosine reductase